MSALGSMRAMKNTLRNPKKTIEILSMSENAPWAIKRELPVLANINLNELNCLLILFHQYEYDALEETSFDT